MTKLSKFLALSKLCFLFAIQVSQLSYLSSCPLKVANGSYKTGMGQVMLESSTHSGQSQFRFKPMKLRVQLLTCLMTRVNIKLV